MTFFAFILFGHMCIEVPEDLDKCNNIYEFDKSKHISLQSCLDRAGYLGTQIQLNLKKKGTYATEMTIYCIPSDNSMTHGIVWK
jgi:hypothetical protein